MSIWKKTGKDGFPIFEHTEHPSSGFCPKTGKRFKILNMRWWGEPVIGGDLKCSECGAIIDY